MISPLVRLFGRDERILVGAATGDDAGVFRFGDRALVATAEFITPVCEDPHRFGRVAVANALSDVYAMGGRPLFALNLCCFPELEGEGAAALAGILRGAAETLVEAGAALLGGHSVRDPELKFGLSVVGEADPDRLLTNAGACPRDRLLLTKPLGTGILINAFKADKLDAAGLEPALRQMERLNDVASRLALEHGVRAATDVTGFGLAGHALGMARASEAALRFRLRPPPPSTRGGLPADPCGGDHRLHGGQRGERGRRPPPTARGSTGCGARCCSIRRPREVSCSPSRRRTREALPRRPCSRAATPTRRRGRRGASRRAGDRSRSSA